MKRIMLVLALFVTGNALAKGQVFYRLGSANIQMNRDGQIFTDVGGANGLNSDDKGMSIGAGLDMKLFDCLVYDKGEVFGEIFVNYTKFSEERVASAASVLASSDSSKKEVNVSELNVTIAPKYKVNWGRFKPWIIPIGLSFLVNSPPSDTTNYLDIGYHAAIGAEFEVFDRLSLGVDFRYTKGSGDPSYAFESLDAGAYMGLNF